MNAKLMLEHGNLWEKGKYKRIYLDKYYLIELCGVEVHKRRTGSIESATLNGEEISNREGGRWLTAANGVYYDYAADALKSKYNDEYTAIIIDIASKAFN